MPTPFESAQLLLNLYELRREEKMRQGRDLFMGFDPGTFEEFMGGMMGPQGGFIRMVVSYWDMAGSLVKNGAIDPKMFYDANSEFVLVFARVEPFLAQAREMFGNPDAFRNLEWLALNMPNARERIDGTRERFRAMLAARTATAKAGAAA